MTPIEERNKRDELRNKWVREAHKELDKIESCEIPSQLSWLRQAFVAHYWSAEDLRQDLRELRALALAWANESGRELTVKDAQMLDACRICKKKPTLPLILDCGTEYACQSCLEKELEREHGLELLENVKRVLYKSVHYICKVSDQCKQCSGHEYRCHSCMESLDFVNKIDVMLKGVDSHAKFLQSQIEQSSLGLPSRK